MKRKLALRCRLGGARFQKRKRRKSNLNNRLVLSHATLPTASLSVHKRSVQQLPNGARNRPRRSTLDAGRVEDVDDVGVSSSNGFYFFFFYFFFFSLLFWLGSLLRLERHWRRRRRCRNKRGLEKTKQPNRFHSTTNKRLFIYRCTRRALRWQKIVQWPLKRFKDKSIRFKNILTFF